MAIMQHKSRVTEAQEHVRSLEHAIWQIKFAYMGPLYKDLQY